MLKIERILQRTFCAEVEGKQLQLVVRFYCREPEEIAPQIFEEKGLDNVGKFVKRSADFYLLRADGSKSYGSLKGKRVFKTVNSKQQACYIVLPRNFTAPKEFALIYRVEEA